MHIVSLKNITLSRKKKHHIYVHGNYKNLDESCNKRTRKTRRKGEGGWKNDVLRE